MQIGVALARNALSPRGSRESAIDFFGSASPSQTATLNLRKWLGKRQVLREVLPAAREAPHAHHLLV
ncbi:hypothetical protein [Sorangium sp. So ce426]|uniref:hypothetical protein n=1 Tax=Sorangium sp. So ce426 TaxID=3133312 RepID=UPI003F5BB6BF